MRLARAQGWDIVDGREEQACRRNPRGMLCEGSLVTTVQNVLAGTEANHGRDPVRVRAGWVSDADIADLAAACFPDPVTLDLDGVPA